MARSVCFVLVRFDAVLRCCVVGATGYCRWPLHPRHSTHAHALHTLPPHWLAGWPGHQKQTQPDGTTIEVTPDGHQVETHSDGVMIVDGDEVSQEEHKQYVQEYGLHVR